MSLRLLLVIIGVILIAGVYVFSVAKRRRDTRLNFNRRFSHRDIPDVMLQHDEPDDDEDDPGAVALPRRGELDLDLGAVPAEPPPGHGDWTDDDARTEPARPTAAGRQPAATSARAPGRVVLGEDEASLATLPQVRNDAVDDTTVTASRGHDQLDLFGAAARARGKRGSARAAPAKPAPAAPDNAPDDGLIKLLVRAREGRQFGGPELVRALNAIGMQYGEMSIFHHYGPAEMRRGEPIFSAANLFEPGTFDLPRIEAFRTSGIVLFMQLPAPLEGPVAFELFLNSAQRLVELTGGELFAAPNRPLDPDGIAHLRGRAARFSHER